MFFKLSFSAVAILLFARTGGGQAPVGGNTPTGIARGLLKTPGPAFDSASSAHFLVFAEQGDRPRYDIRAIVDSLETARRDDMAILERTDLDVPMITVLVTRSRHRFAQVMSPRNKGISIAAQNDGETIVLVHNDSVRLYARHEVMHTLSRRAWGTSENWWMMEGIAVVADPRCLGSTSMALARDVLRARTELTAGVLMKSFRDLVREDLASTYAVAGSLVSFLRARGGISLVQQAWTSELALLDLPQTTDQWRAYVEEASVRQSGPSPDSVARLGCG